MPRVPKRSAILGATTSLGFVPGLVLLAVAGKLFIDMSAGWMMGWHIRGTYVFANQYLNVGLLGIVALAYLAWVLALARGWVTGATGGGFAVAAVGVFLRSVAEMPHLIAQVPLAESPPPEPFATVLPLARGLGLVAVVFGLACVLAACLSERRLRRSGPAWTLPR